MTEGWRETTRIRNKNKLSTFFGLTTPCQDRDTKQTTSAMPAIGKRNHAQFVADGVDKHQHASNASGVVHGAQNAPLLAKSNQKENPRKKRTRKKAPPSEYLVFTNPDKKAHSRPPEHNPCQPGHPSRIIVVGKPGCGKRGVFLNTLEGYDFDFDTITEVHASAKSEEHDVFKDADDYQLWQWDTTTDGDTSEPYKYIGVPPISRFEKRGPDGEKLHNLLIMDEPPCEWSTDLKRKVGTLMNYNSTHNNCTIFLITQHFQNLPLQIRGAATHFIFFPTKDPHLIRFFSRNCGVNLDPIFRQHCRNEYDSIMVDMTGHGPRVRRNVYEVIQGGEVVNELVHKQVKDKKRKKEDESSDDDHGGGGRARRQEENF